MNEVSVIKNESGFFPYPFLEKHGRLAFELGNSRKETLAQIAADLHKAALVMGISIDGEKSAITAAEALKKISEVYPTAWLKDVSKAIEMASFGQIKLPDQLNTLSAANIFQWYRELRLNHPDKVGVPHLHHHETQEVSPEEKAKMMIHSFGRFLETYQKDEIAQTVYFDRLVKIGAVDISNEAKNERLIEELRKLVSFFPTEILGDRALRKQAMEFKHFFADLPEPKTVRWSDWANNSLVVCAIRNLKRKLVVEALDFCDHEELKTNYKNQISDELKVALQ